jgi:hypothetical protein
VKKIVANLPDRVYVNDQCGEIFVGSEWGFENYMDKEFAYQWGAYDRDDAIAEHAIAQEELPEDEREEFDEDAAYAERYHSWMEFYCNDWTYYETTEILRWYVGRAARDIIHCY